MRCLLRLTRDDYYLFSTHLAAGQSYVIDLATNKVVATIASPPGIGVLANRNGCMRERETFALGHLWRLENLNTCWGCALSWNGEMKLAGIRAVPCAMLPSPIRREPLYSNCKLLSPPSDHDGTVLRSCDGESQRCRVHPDKEPSKQV